MLETVICITCQQEVAVKLVPYGHGKVAICPLCGKLAYANKGDSHEKEIRN